MIMADGLPKILLLDIETFPIEVYCWSLYDQTIPLNMIKQNTTLASWAAKWFSEEKVYYSDVSGQKNLRDDLKITKSLQALIEKADIIVGHNLRRFDQKKVNYRAIVNNLLPTKKVQTIDTLVIARKYFAFDSNKLEHLAKILDLKYKKLKHEKFSGNELWTECLKGNKQAWQEMRHYNKYDVLVLEECYKRLISWDDSINFNVYNDNNENKCSCGSFVVVKKGFRYSKAGKYQSYICSSCGKQWQARHNLLSSLKRSDILK